MLTPPCEARGDGFGTDGAGQNILDFDAQAGGIL